MRLLVLLSIALTASAQYNPVYTYKHYVASCVDGFNLKMHKDKSILEVSQAQNLFQASALLFSHGRASEWTVIM